MFLDPVIAAETRWTTNCMKIFFYDAIKLTTLNSAVHLIRTVSLDTLHWLAMLNSTVNSSLRIIRTVCLYSDGDELSGVNCIFISALEQDQHIIVCSSLSLSSRMEITRHASVSRKNNITSTISFLIWHIISQFLSVPTANYHIVKFLKIDVYFCWVYVTKWIWK